MSLIVMAILAIVGGWLIWWLLLGPLARIIAQLTQSISQLALKPGDEEIKKKGWWKFWKCEEYDECQI
jgi:hypothetical protein